jgi:hypothetical protein
VPARGRTRLSLVQNQRVSLIVPIDDEKRVRSVTSACGAPGPEKGRARFVGMYVLADRRVPTTDVNPEFRLGSLVLMSDGNARQVCEFKNGARYESSRMTWAYDGDGNVSLSPLKDCSWVWGAFLDHREGPLESPRSGASLIVEWNRHPVILMDPDVNAFYEWQGPPR